MVRDVEQAGVSRVRQREIGIDVEDFEGGAIVGGIFSAPAGRQGRQERQGQQSRDPLICSVC